MHRVLIAPFVSVQPRGPPPGPRSFLFETIRGLISISVASAWQALAVAAYLFVAVPLVVVVAAAEGVVGR